MTRLGDPRRRLRALLVTIGFIVSLFGARLLQLQGVDASAYAATGEKTRLTTVALPAERGSILDSNGVPLATSLDLVNLTTDQTLVSDPKTLADVLAPILRANPATLRQALTGTKRYNIVARDVDPRTWKAVQKALAEHQPRLVGIFSEPVAKRSYPNGSLAANVVGFVGADGTGLGGLEYKYQDVLAGQPGQETYQRAMDGRQIATAGSTEQAPVPGEDVVTTIDRDLQYVAQEAIAAKVKEAGADSGTVVVQDPRTGEILALATAPSFDPNAPGKSPAADRGNRAVSEIYEPGSVAKLMTASAAIDTGVATPLTPVTVPNTLLRAGKTFHDDISHPTWHLTFTGVIARSSNIGTIQIAERIGWDRLYGYLKKFGIGDPTGLGFPGESRGLLPPPSQWSGTQRYTIPFGQGVSVNSIQATSVFATIANGGVRVAPSLVKGTRDADGVFTPAPAPAQTRVVSASTAKQVSAMLEAVTGADGTAPMAAVDGYRVAGKTGTAQRVDPACGCYRGYTASFIGFAPADDPRFVISVTLQNPKNGHFGGRLGGPVFKQVMSFALRQAKVPPSGSKPPQLPISLDPSR